MQQSFHKYFRFESAGILCDQFNKFGNTLKKEKEETDDKYPWLDKNDERRNMSDKATLEKYEDLEELCHSETERKEVKDMMYKYKGTFSLRDKIVACQNIEVK